MNGDLAFSNAAMILSGMGPLAQPPGGKVFAGLYALYSGLAVPAGSIGSDVIGLDRIRVRNRA